MMGIVERIKEKCNEKGLNIATLEKELSIGNGNIRRWNTNTPSAKRILEVANMLETSVDWLLTGKDNENLSEEEAELLEKWRRTNDKGRESIMSVADAMALTQPRHEPLSTSQTG